MNAQMFNSFLDGTKSAIEMAAVANATGLAPRRTACPSRPAASTTCRACCGPPGWAAACPTPPRPGRGGVQPRARRPAGLPRPALGRLCHLRGVGHDYVARCFREYGLVTDPSGRYAAMYKPYHLIGLELGISVAMAGLRGEATGAAPGLPGRRGGHRQARPRRGRDPRRRGRLHGLWPPDAGRRFAGAGRPAARPRRTA
jgi:hypothetical protein